MELPIYEALEQAGQLELDSILELQVKVYCLIVQLRPSVKLSLQ